MHQESLLLRSIAEGKFLNTSEHYNATVGAEVHPMDHKGTRLLVWDTAGKKTFAGLFEGYLVDADVVLFFRSKKSKRGKEILKRLDTFIAGCKILYVKSKSDLDETHDRKEGVFHISSVTGDGVDTLLDEIVK